MTRSDQDLNENMLQTAPGITTEGQESISEMISDRLLALRKQSGLTPGQLATKAGVSVLTINLYENPYYEQYELKTLQKLIEACGGTLLLSILNSK